VIKRRDHVGHSTGVYVEAYRMEQPAEMQEIVNEV
jgi:hypothetical protein